MDMAAASEGMSAASTSDGGTASAASAGSAEQAGTPASSPEKTFSQSQLNEIVGRTREEARKSGYNRAKQEAEIGNVQGTQQQQATQQQSTQTQQSSFGGVTQLTSQQIDELVDKRVTAKANEEYAKRLINDFTGKLELAKGNHNDFDDVIQALNLPQHPHLVGWANGLENCAEVLYDLGNNPSKYANILMLSQTAPQLALREMQKLSDSITSNVK